jgi:hypothetical protein
MNKYQPLTEPNIEAGPSTDGAANMIDQIAEAVCKKLGCHSVKPETGLTERVEAWKRAPQKDRPEFTPDNRPQVKISAESQWRPPWLNEVGADNVIRPTQPVEGWQKDFEWNQSALRMSGYFHRVASPIFHEPENKSESPGPNLPVGDKHKISW